MIFGLLWHGDLRFESLWGRGDHSEKIGDAVAIDERDVESGDDGRFGAGGDDMPGEITEPAGLVDGSGLDEAQPQMYR